MFLYFLMLTQPAISLNERTSEFFGKNFYVKGIVQVFHAISMLRVLFYDFPPDEFNILLEMSQSFYKLD